MRVGIVCPYTWDVPGGVQAHVNDSSGMYAALGLRACHDAGIVLPRGVLERGVKWWRNHQMVEKQDKKVDRKIRDQKHLQGMLKN